MSSSKTFRLFISSTFSDFKKEREILQTRVFPKVKEYSQEKGYSFQPIDLRWGVSNEAQLDQKTLELCLSEVRACKSNPYPNFLVMLGDRYGWIPLPYAIEAKEFETLLESMEQEERDSLLEWYKLDLNQLPASYILKERSGIYAKYDNWESVEKKLRDILQKAVNGSRLDEEPRAKYFLSATEAEVKEGIIPYMKPTPFQEKKLLSDNSTLEEVEPQYLFGFFRNIDKTTAISDKFIKDDYDKAQEFKERVKSVFTKKNIENNVLKVTTTQKDKESLDESYLAEFEEKIMTFLISQIDSHIRKETQEKVTPLKKETDAQLFFAQQKREDFLGQEETLKTIAEYLQGESKKPFVLYGASGRGKSSIMAKAIEQEKTNSSAKILYRFVGATPNASSSKEILLSLFDEIGKDIRHESEKHQEPQTELLLDANKESESFENFSYRVYDEFANIKEDVVFFIDAVDQFSHDDNFLWLREELPSNIKIVLSALDDANYKEDSRYFQTLKNKTNNIHEIPPFSDPEKLLFALLEKEGRTIQQNQLNYFLEQYETSSSPLYVTVAAQEIKNWKSYDYMQGETPKDGAKEQDLRNTQRSIIEEYVENLTSLYHQESAFVQKVLGYIYASRDGLSESELLELINTDKEFVEKMAPETYHENSSKELPLVHWSRLHTQLKPFLSIKKQDNEELMYFFHREFEDVIASMPNQKDEHQAIIQANQALITQNQEKPFEQNRWGKLYATLITEYELRYKEQEKLQEYAEFVAKLGSEKWIDEFLFYITKMDYEHNVHNRMYQAIAYQEVGYSATKLLYESDEKWALNYTTTLLNRASSYSKQNLIKEAIKFYEEAMEIAKSQYINNPETWTQYYIASLNNLATCYRKIKNFNKAEELNNETLNITTILYKENSLKWTELYSASLSNFATFYLDINNIYKAVELGEEALYIREKSYRANPKKSAESYVTSLSNVAEFYRRRNNPGDLDKAVDFCEKALSITEQLYRVNQSRWVVLYTDVLNTLARFYKEQNRFDEAIKLEKFALSIVEEHYINDSMMWIKNYILSLNNLAYSYANQNCFDEALTLYEKAKEITKPRYINNPEIWAEYYTTVLDSLGKTLGSYAFYLSQNQIDKAIQPQKRAVIISNELYRKNPERWAELFSENIGILGMLYTNQHAINKAVACYEIALSIMATLYENNKERWIEPYLNTLNVLAGHYDEQNKKEKSLAIFRHAYEISKKDLGKNHHITKKFEDNYYHAQYKEESKINMMAEGNLTTILSIAKGIAIHLNENEITAKHLLSALCYVELEEKAYNIFSEMFGHYMQKIQEASGGEEIIKDAMQYPEISFHYALDLYIDKFQEIFGDEKICRVR